MSTNIRQGHVTGSGAVLDVTTSVSLENTIIRGIFATGIGSFLITGVSTDPYGNKTGNTIKFNLTTAIDACDIKLPEYGIRMDGVVKVSAPSSAATVALFYG